MISKCLPLFLCLFLAAACGESPEGGAANQAERGAAEPAQENPVANSSRDPSSVAPASTATVASRPLVWVGRFAASERLCTGGAWRFSRTEVVTDGETACTIANIAEDPGSAKLTLSCSGEGMDTLETWALTPQGDNGLRLVREGAGKPVTLELKRCG